MAERRYRSDRGQDGPHRPSSRPGANVRRTPHSPAVPPPASSRHRTSMDGASHARPNTPHQARSTSRSTVYDRRDTRPAPAATRQRNAAQGQARHQATPTGARRRQTRRPANARPPRSKLALVIPVLVIIALVCVIRFVACSGDGNGANSQASVTTGTVQDASSASTNAHDTTPVATMLTGNAENRAMTSASANDVKPTEKVVYLTFDDGPSEHTQQILDTLDAYGIKATWFILGNTGHIDTVKEIWERGHQVGLHSSEHDYDYIYANPDNFVADIEKVGSAVSERIGFMPTLIRFPGGSVNGYNAGRADAFKQAAADHGWHFFDWNVSIGDSTQPPASVETLVGNIESEAQGCNSCNVLMHDSDFKPTTPEALPQVIEYFISQGYSFDVIGADSFGYHF